MKKKKKKTKYVTKWRWDYELINENKPLWLRDKKEITKEEYYKFYKALTKDSEEHGKLEGEVNFRYILYISAQSLIIYMIIYAERIENILEQLEKDDQIISYLKTAYKN